MNEVIPDDGRSATYQRRSSLKQSAQTVMQSQSFISKVSYKVYNLLGYILITLLICSILLIWWKSSNSIEMTALDEQIKNASDELNVASEKNALGTSNIELAIDRNQKQTELDTQKRKYKKTVYIDNYCDKFIDLCNGVVGALTLVYIGSASYKRMIKKNETQRQRPRTSSLEMITDRVKGVFAEY